MPLNILIKSNTPYLRKGKFSHETYLWHLRLSHINPNIIHGLVKSGILNSLIFELLLVCESCLEGKMTKRPFMAKGYCATKQLRLVHTNVSGPMMFKLKVGMSISPPLLMTTQAMDMFT